MQNNVTLKKSNHSAMVIAAYAVVYIVWGSTFFFIEKALHSFPPFVLGSLRFVSASLILMTYCQMKGYKLFSKKAVFDALLVGFLLLFIDMGAVIWAEQYISSGIVAIMSAAAAIWFVLLDKSKWKENFTSVPTVAGLFLGFLGVVMLFGEQLTMADDPSKRTLRILAMVAMIVGSIAWTAGSLYSKYSSKKEENENVPKEDLHVMVKTAWQMVIAGVMFSLVALFNGEYANFDYTTVATKDWWALLYLIGFGSILAFSSYIWLLQVRPATEVSTYAYVNPIVAVILAYFFTAHVVTSLQISGLVIVLVSVLLMNWNLYKNNKTVMAVRNKGFRRKSVITPKESISIKEVESEKRNPKALI
ncbi:EamA family transporter [Sphingobacterium sp. SYP-B4668]|uniref:EamA family transporter n=1 Tax=Sphingobacterium sp. SYP-B4668 TaxID=2996035 RepID=UPI0022DD79C3|nr:EamA family transporter [Sphingobacterium sp. SYP-B4668]